MLDPKEIEFEFRCRSDFVYFCENVLNMEMTSYHVELASLPVQHRQLCVIVPRGHGKTMLYSIAYPLWRLWREKNFELCLTSSSLEQSMKIFAKSQELLESNPFFSRILPQDRFSSWNKSQLVTRNGNWFYVKPFNSTARGIHPHCIIYDDLLREMDTPLEQIEETFWGVFYPCGQINNCQHLIVGTPQTPDDLYAKLEKLSEKDKDWQVVRKRAVIKDEKGNWVRALWESRLPLDVLRKIRESMGEYRFEREYQCNPIATGDTLYPQEMILDCLDNSLEYSFKSEGSITIGCDFAISTAASGDYNVFTVVDNCAGQEYIKETDNGKVKVKDPVFIRRIIRFRGNTGHVESIKNLCASFPSSRVIADNSHVGARFVQELRENYITVDGQDFQPAHRNMMLMNLRRLIEQKRLVIPYKGEYLPLTKRLMKELASFRSKKLPSGGETWVSSVDHDDMVFSLALAVRDIGSPRRLLDTMFVGIKTPEIDESLDTNLNSS